MLGIPGVAATESASANFEHQIWPPLQGRFRYVDLFSGSQCNCARLYAASKRTGRGGADLRIQRALVAALLRPFELHDLVVLYELTCRVGHALRHKSAGAFGPDLAKKLSQLVKMEKNVMRSMELVGRERMEVAVSAFDFWDAWCAI